MTTINATRIVIDGGNTVNKSNVTFDNLSHSEFGAAIYNSNGTMLTTNVDFLNNSAKNGGAIMIGTLAQSNYIHGGVFSANSAIQAGGAAAIYADTYISGTLFSANSAEIGGALRITSNAENIVLSDTNFYKNYVTKNGGAIYTEGNVSIDGGTFTENYASNNSINCRGGAICNFSGGNLNVSNGTLFESNYAKTWGGAILNNGTLNVNGATFTRNSASETGGAVQNVYECMATIENALFDNNSATNQGGAIMAGGTTTIIGNTFNGNLANEGGAVFVRLNTGIGVVSNNTFTSNTAKHGGAIYNKNIATVSGTTFTDNVASIGGGGILNAYGASGNVISCTFYNNTASNYGGGINNNGNIMIDGCHFKNNSAIAGGGAFLNAANGSANIHNVIFEGNSAPNYGGAINNAGNLLITGKVTLTTTNDTIYNVGVISIDCTRTGTICNINRLINDNVVKLLINSDTRCYRVGTFDTSFNMQSTKFVLERTDLSQSSIININDGIVTIGENTYELKTKSHGLRSELVLRDVLYQDRNQITNDFLARFDYY